MAFSHHEIPLILLLCCVPTIAAEPERFLCITDHVTGFSHNEESRDWERSSFLPGERFLITATEPDHYRIEKLDEFRAWSADCRPRSDVDDDSFTCEDGTNAVHFNRAAGRFTAFRYFGFWTGSTDSMSISIGSCRPD